MGGRLRFFVSGGAPLDPELVRFFARLGLPILQGYGLTETAPVVTCTKPGDVRPGSVGTVLPQVEVRIAGDGEILVRGPNVMTGYCDDPAATAEVLDPDGTFHTGDLGHLDGDGHLFITGRKKELIIGSGGKNVAPARIEALLKRHRIIGDACVVGDRHPYLVALLVPDEAALKPLLQESGASWPSRGALPRDPAVRARFAAAIEAVNADLAPPERVRRFALLPEPFSIDNGQLTPTLKVRRREIEQRWRREIDALYAAT
jgi:long-chain acyl-CoA synthetase